MATLIDIPEEEPQVAPQEEQLEPIQAEEQAPEEDIPEKYKGKSLKDLVQMHQEAEKAIGRQGSEVGELRKLVDQYIVSNTAPPKEEPQEEVDFWADPEKAIEQKLQNHPKLKEWEQEREIQKRQSSQQMVASKHPDYQDILQTPEFADWIKGSKIRTKLFIQADQGYDADAADELFSLWKERKSLSQATVESDKASRKEAIKGASTGNARGSSNPPGRKIYRRADIVRLMEKDPDRYASMADEFLRAYAEGRVK